MLVLLACTSFATKMDTMACLLFIWQVNFRHLNKTVSTGLALHPIIFNANRFITHYITLLIIFSIES